MNVAAYCRVSTDKEDQLNSLEAQKKFFTEFTEKNGAKRTSMRDCTGSSISGCPALCRRGHLRNKNQKPTRISPTYERRKKRTV